MSFSTQKYIVQKVTMNADEKKTIKNYHYDSTGKKTCYLSADEKFEKPEPSNSGELVEYFIKTIKEDDYNSYFSLLEQGYIYRVLEVEKITQQDAEITYVNCVMREMIEAIYFYNTSGFLRLINALIKKNDVKYFNAFVETITHNTTLDVYGLFYCTPESKFEAYEVLNELKSFSPELKKEIRDLVIQLEVQAKEPAVLFKNLRIKCQILELLKNKVSLAARLKDDSTKCNAVNLLTILFLAAIPNVINFIATCGNDFLFFNKKTPRDLVSAIGVGGSMLPHQFRKAP